MELNGPSQTCFNAAMYSALPLPVHTRSALALITQPCQRPTFHCLYQGSRSVRPGTFCGVKQERSIQTSPLPRKAANIGLMQPELTWLFSSTQAVSCFSPHSNVQHGQLVNLPNRERRKDTSPVNGTRHIMHKDKVRVTRATGYHAPKRMPYKAENVTIAAA
jgi:hypothetical protein